MVRFGCSYMLGVLKKNYMRIGFIGLATPIAYDYKSPASNTRADLKSSPNPILDSPWGIMLMFDEIWFLTKSLCPENLRNSQFVRFIDESEYLNKLDISDYKLIKKGSDNEIQEKIDQTIDKFSNFDHSVKMRGVHWDAAPDNHTHGLRIGNETMNGNWASFRNILYDQMILERLRELSGEYIEYVPNSFTYHWFSTESDITDKVLTDELIKVVFPNYLHRNGPFHPVINEIRNIPEINDFRRFILPKAETISLDEAKKAANRIRSELQLALEETYLNQHEEYGVYDAGLMFLFKQAIQHFSITLNTIFHIKESLSEANKIRKFSKLRWQPFLIKTDQKIKNA